MRLIIMSILLVYMFAAAGQSQEFMYFGVGYNMSLQQSDGLDYVIARYNETRPYLSETMENPRYFDGLALRFGGATGAFLFDFGYTQQSCVVSASGIDASGIEQQRDVKDKWNTIDIGLGVCIGASENFSLGAGVNFGLNSEKYLTRADTPDDIGVANFAQINKQFKIGMSPFIQFTVSTEEGPGILFRPYYSWSPVKTDYTALNAYINPYTYAADPSQVEGTLSGFGLSIALIGYGFND